VFGGVPEPLDAVEDQIERELEIALIDVAGSFEVLHDVLGEVGVDLPPAEPGP